MRIFKALHRNGRTLVLVTHDREIALQSDRIIEMKDGRIIADRPTSDASAEVVK
jgi:ABC-type lipoprotein export system ATPase subunit